MNFYYVGPINVSSENHKVFVIPFRTADQLVEIDPLFDWTKTSYAWRTLLRNKPDAMKDAEILETMYGVHTVLFIKQRSSTSIKQLIKSCMDFAREHQYRKIEVPAFTTQHVKNPIRTMCRAISDVSATSGNTIDIIFVLTPDQTAEAAYCKKIHIKQA